APSLYLSISPSSPPPRHPLTRPPPLPLITQGGWLMTRVLRSLAAYLRASLAVMFQYRGEIVLWALWGVVYPLVAMAMWRAAIEGAPNGQAIQGLDAGDFAAYFLLTMVVGHVATAWDVYEMGYLVRTG